MGAEPPSEPIVVVLEVPEMSCAACERLIEHALRRCPEVLDAKADAGRKLVHVRLAAPVAPETLAACVSTAGYAARPVGGN